MNKICAIGSLNTDLTITLPRFHAPGETITGTAFHTYTGGKGGNQAIAAARLGAEVMMVGKLGQDSHGALYRQALGNAGVDTGGILDIKGVPSGVALIEVDAHGENRIAIVQGTNALVDAALVDQMMPRILGCDIILLQLEIPIDTVCYAAKRLREAGKRVILDPAPAIPLPEPLLAAVHLLTPNESELSLLSGMPTQSYSQVVRAARALIDRGAQAVVAKLGARGAAYVDAQRDVLVPGFATPVVDTTGAGDSFNAGLAVALARGEATMEQAIRFANAVGALSTTGAGAQQAMPSLEQVRALLADPQFQGDFI